MFAVKRFKEVMVVMLKRFLELPKKYAVGNLNLVCYVLVVGESCVAGGGRGLGPEVGGKSGLEESLSLRWRKSETRGWVGRSDEPK